MTFNRKPAKKVWIVHLAVLLVAGFIMPQNFVLANDDTGTNPVHHYEFNESAGNTAIDSVGSQNGTIRGGAVWEVGKKGRSLQFNGSNTFVDLGQSTIGQQHEFSIEAWINPAANQGNVNVIIGQQKTGVVPYQFLMYIKNGSLNFVMTNESGQHFGLYPLSAADTVPANTWSHVALIRDENTFTMYVNGIEVARKTSSTFINQPDNPNNMTIGADWTTAGTAATHVFNGKIDDVKIYDAALDATTVTAHYNSAPPAVVASIPADQGLHASVMPITVTMDVQIQEGENFDQIKLQQGTTDVEADVTISGNTISITPSEPLTEDSEYTLTIPAASVKDMNGNIMEDEFVLSFTAVFHSLDRTLKGVYFIDATGVGSAGKTYGYVPPVSGEYLYKYLLSSSGAPVSVPSIGDKATAYIDFPADGLIAATDGQHIGVALVSKADNSIVKFTNTQAVVKDSTIALPTPQQVAWQNEEISMFLHIQRAANINNLSFSKFDADNWVDQAISMGAKSIVVVAKHTDGFAWWQTETTDFSIKTTPFGADGRDVVAEVFDAARQRGLKVGFYLCPRDDHFGARDRGITSDPAKQNEYNQYYLNQLDELISNYGELNEIWFDGSLHPALGPLVDEAIHDKQPNAVTFLGTNAAIRWIGDEGGRPPVLAWNTVTRNAYLSMRNGGWSTSKDGDPDGVYWQPNEADTTLSTDWFGGSARSLDDLVNVYYNTVGNSAKLMLNISPSQDGSINPSYMTRAQQFGDEIRSRVGYPISETSGNGDSLVLVLDEATEIDHVIVQEDIFFGERVRSYKIEGMVNDVWQQIATGTSIGYKKIHHINPVTVTQIRFTALSTAAAPDDEVRIKKMYVTRTGIIEDATPPSVPINVMATAIDEHKVELSWDSSTDEETGIARYNIYRNGILLTSTTGTSFIDHNVVGSTQYEYQVSAVNGTNIEGTMSALIQVSTPTDYNPPAIQTVFNNPQGNQVTVQFNETIDRSTAEMVSNYTLDNGIVISSATLQSDNKSVLLVTSQMAELQTYQLTVRNVKDTSTNENAIATISYSFIHNASMVKYFKFDEASGTIAYDEISMSNANLFGNPAHVPGKKGNALSFNGSNTYVDIGPSPVRSDQFSVEAWIKPTSIGGTRVIVSQQTSGVVAYQWAFYLNAQGKIVFEMTDDQAKDYGLWEFSGGTVLANQWSHIAVTKNGNTYSLYVNGVKVNTKTTTAVINQPYNLNNMLIGSDKSSSGNPVSVFNGLIDDVRFYSVSLDETTVQQHASD